MGKGTDKLYITHSEWSSSDQFSASAGSGVRDSRLAQGAFKRLPYNFCSLSLQPFTDPVCTGEGQIFDHENIIRWLINHDTNPTNGKALKSADLIKLNFAKNELGDYVDPVTFKEFTDNTHIIAIRHGETANVFAYDTVERLNFKAKMMVDLVSDKPFSKIDIITLQDPQNLEARNLSTFKYLADGEDAGVPKEDAGINTSAMGDAQSAKILKAREAIARSRAERNAAVALPAAPKPPTTTTTQQAAWTKASILNSVKHHTTGQAAASFTSTGLTPHTSATPVQMSEEEYLLVRGRVKQIGFARLETTQGDISIELYPEYAPKAVYNFLQLCKSGYYDNTTFHRNIKNFMIQGGDPDGTGRGGQSYWRKPFEDEFEGPLKHDRKGVMSMANKGKNTNGSQFFILYRQAPHLDRKHTIFGRVVDSDETLAALEKVKTTESDRPIEDIVLNKAVVMLNPFEQFLEHGNSDFVGKSGGSGGKVTKSKRKMDEEDERMTWTGKRINTGGVPDENRPVTVVEPSTDFSLRSVPKPKKQKGFGNFDNW